MAQFSNNFRCFALFLMIFSFNDVFFSSPFSQFYIKYVFLTTITKIKDFIIDSFSTYYKIKVLLLQ